MSHLHQPARRGRPAALAALGACVAAAALLVCAAVAAAAGASLTLSGPIPMVARAGTPVQLSGRVSRAPAGAVVVLEQRQLGGSASWVVGARSRLRGGSFHLTWPPAGAGVVMLRVAVRLHGRDLTATAAQRLLVGSAPVYCAAPAPPASVPSGDGWVVGGLYDAGGPAPGGYWCVQQSYTLTVTDAAGATVASQAVAAGQSYTIVLAPGTYDLASGYCRGTAKVAAGQQTHADTVCAVP